MHLLRSLVLLFSAAICLSSAETCTAGVAGKSYSGTLLGENGATGTSCIMFETNGSVVYDELIEGAPLEVFRGKYVEINLFLISFWSAELIDASPDGKFNASGISVLGFIVWADFRNPDFSPDFTGTYLRSNCTPGTSTGGARAGVADGRD